jgi:hypothetical protein
MTPADLRLLCTALGFTAVVMRGEKLPKKEGALRATGFANLIEEFCRASVPEALDRTASVDPCRGSDHGRIPDAERMAAVIVEIIKEKGGCLPQDLAARGFTPDEIDRHWPMAKALAYVELNIMDS